MIFNLLFFLTFWCAGISAEDIFELPDGAQGSIAASCAKLFLRTNDNKATHNEVTLSLFGLCTYDGLPHDLVTEPRKFRKAGLDLSKILVNGQQEFLWASKDSNKPTHPASLDRCHNWKISGTIISATCATPCEQNKIAENSGTQCNDGTVNLVKHLDLGENIINSDGKLFYQHNLDLQPRATGDGGFADGCTDYALGWDGVANTRFFTAKCVEPSGNYRTTTLDLGLCIVNDFGSTAWEDLGGYQDSCEVETCTLYFTSMTCFCFNDTDDQTHPSFLDLNEHIRNEKGHLACWNHIGS